MAPELHPYPIATPRAFLYSIIGELKRIDNAAGVVDTKIALMCKCKILHMDAIAVVHPNGTYVWSPCTYKTSKAADLCAPFHQLLASAARTPVFFRTVEVKVYGMRERWYTCIVRDARSGFTAHTCWSLKERCAWMCSALIRPWLYCIVWIRDSLEKKTALLVCLFCTVHGCALLILRQYYIAW